MALLLFYHEFTKLATGVSFFVPVTSYRYFVSNYDVKQYLKTFFLKDQILFFRAHSRFIVGRSQGWKYRLVIDKRYYILCFSVIDYRRCFAFNVFYRLLPFLCFLLTFYRLAESLNFTFVFVEST